MKIISGSPNYGLFYTAYSQSAANYWVDNPVSWVGTDGTYTASSSFRYTSSGYGPGLVFATSVSSGLRDGWVGLCGTSEWLRLQLPRRKVATRFRFYTRANKNDNAIEAPKGFSITASNDGIVWTTIYETADTPPGWKSGNHQASDWINTAGMESYLYYQLNVKDCSSSSGRYLGIGKWEIEGYAVLEYNIIKSDDGANIKKMQFVMD